VSDYSGPLANREVALVEVLDRALGAGVVITGDIRLSLADIDLVYLSLRLIVGSTSTVRGKPGAELDAGPLALPAPPDVQQ
jgi:hypothetical protein